MRPPSYRPAVARSARLFIPVMVMAASGCGGGGQRPDGGGVDQRSDSSQLMDLQRPDAWPIDWGATGLDGQDHAEVAVDSVIDDAQSDGDVPLNGRCSAAAQLTFVSGRAVATGDTSLLTDEYDALKCKGTGVGSDTVMSGPQAYYRFGAKAAQWYKVTVAPAFSAYAYVFTSGCDEAQIGADCRSGGLSGQTSTFISAGVPESFYYRASQQVDVYVAVDSSSTTNAGPFTLTVDQLPEPTNATCNQSTKLTFLGGVASVQGDVGPVLTPDEFPTLDCGTNKAFDGPQVYYRFEAAEGKAYRVNLIADTAMFLHAYVFGHGCAEGEIEADCASAGYSGDVLDNAVSGGNQGSFLFMPQAPGEYVVAVDTRSPTSFGGFTLTIEELTPAVNASCGAATPIAPGASATVTVTGSTATATNEHGSEIDCGGLTTFDGPQLYYSLDVEPAKGYRIEIAPQFHGVVYAFRASSCSSAAAIDADCGSVGSGGSWGPVFAGDAGTLYLHPDAPGSYILAVDSANNTEVGDFELRITEVDLPANTTCGQATPITLDAAGEAKIEGTTGFSTDEYPSLQCGLAGAVLNGPQVYYALSVSAGHFYELNLTTTFFDGYLYLFGGGVCSAALVAADCGSDGVAGDVLGPVSVGSGVLYHTPGSDGLVRIGVDSAMSPFLADEYGDFALEVRERAPASNGTCAAAEAITLIDEGAAVSGFTVGLSDEFPGAIHCGSGIPFAAGQAYYKVKLEGSPHLVELSADFDAQLYAFADSAAGGCPLPAAIEAACASGGAGGDHLAVAQGSQAAMVRSPPVQTWYYLAVDGATAADVGGFGLTIAPVPAHQRCSQPQPVQLASSPVTISGDTSLGVTDEFSTVSCDNVTGPWSGPQLYYRVALQANKAYTITVRQDGWDPALYAFVAATPCLAAEIDQACSSPAPGDPDRVYNSDTIGVGDETIKIKPTTTEDWIIVVDSFSSVAASGAGSFTLEISW